MLGGPKVCGLRNTQFRWQAADIDMDRIEGQALKGKPMLIFPSDDAQDTYNIQSFWE